MLCLPARQGSTREENAPLLKCQRLLLLLPLLLIPPLLCYSYSCYSSTATPTAALLQSLLLGSATAKPLKRYQAGRGSS